MPKEKPFKLDQVSIRMVMDPPLYSDVPLTTVGGKVNLPPHGKEFFHAAVSIFLHPTVSDVHPYRVTLSCD